MRDDGCFDSRDDAGTPLASDEREGLIPTYITTREQLNEAEHLNIAEAQDWAFRRRREVLTIAFLRALHKRMYGKVWRWAGKWTQQQNRRIGVDHWRVEPELQALFDDVAYWIQHQTWPPDEIATRFHHRLTWIHPFPNGNGRHARMATDLLLVAMGRPRFTWGGTRLVEADRVRARYVAALKVADDHDMGPLLGFVRSEA